MKKVIVMLFLVVSFAGVSLAQQAPKQQVEPKFKSEFIKVNDQIVDQIITDEKGKVVKVQALLASPRNAYITTRPKFIWPRSV